MIKAPTWLAAALLAIACTPAPPPPSPTHEASAPTWTLEREYNTDCFSPWTPALGDNDTYYMADGITDHTFLNILNMRTGECERAKDYDPRTSPYFRPRAQSDHYLLAVVGNYYPFRISLFEKGSWRQVGTTRLNEGIEAAAIEGERLYAIQRRREGAVLTAISLPDLHFVSEVELPVRWDARFEVIPNGFAIVESYDDHAHVSAIDYSGGVLRQSDLPSTLRGCVGLTHVRVNDTIMLVRRACDTTIVDLTSMRRSVDVHNDAGSYLAFAFLAGEHLYLVQSRITTTNETPAEPTAFSVLTFSFRTGQRIGTLPSLRAFEGRPRQSGDRLFWSTYDLRSGQAHIYVYNLNPTTH